MKYFHPIEVGNRVVHFNPKTFRHDSDNLQKIAQVKSPVGIDGKNVTLHHIGRRHNSNLATLTDTFHRQHSDKIHNIAPRVGEEVNRKKFDKEKKDIWKAISNYLLQDFKKND